MHERARSKVRVLFVCTGNICRSPTVEGVFRKLCEDAGLGDRIEVDSAGMIDYHVGSEPDDRSVTAARDRGFDLSDLRARIVRADDFTRFDYILAMDRGHHREMTSMCPIALRGRVRMFLDFAPDLGVAEVADPYYGGPDGFETVLDLAEAGSRALLEHLEREHLA